MSVSVSCGLSLPDGVEARCKCPAPDVFWLGSRLNHLSPVSGVHFFGPCGVRNCGTSPVQPGPLVPPAPLIFNHPPITAVHQAATHTSRRTGIRLATDRKS